MPKPGRWSVERLRREVIAAHREYMCLLALGLAMTRGERQEADAILNELEVADKAVLTFRFAQVRRIVANLRRALGTRVDRAELVQLLHDSEDGPDGTIMYVSKQQMLALAPNLRSVMLQFDALPLHAMFVLDAGRYREQPRQYTIRIPESEAHSDLCALVNETCRTGRSLDLPRATNTERAHHLAIARAACVASTTFVEAYLNGIAYDCFLRRGDALSATERDLLLDWDSGRGRPRYMTIRDKVLQYQRTILNVEHAPIQDTNCAALKFVLEHTELVRHAVIHPSPGRAFAEYEPRRGLVRSDVGVREVVAIAKAAIGSVRAIDVAVNGRIEEWLTLREPDENVGFGQEVFE